MKCFLFEEGIVAVVGLSVDMAAGGIFYCFQISEVVLSRCREELDSVSQMLTAPHVGGGAPVERWSCVTG